MIRTPNISKGPQKCLWGSFVKFGIFFVNFGEKNRGAIFAFDISTEEFSSAATY